MKPEELYENEFKELLTRFESSVNTGNSTPFFDTDDLLDIIDHYFGEEKPEMAKKAIDAGLRLYPDNTDLKLCEVQYIAGEIDPVKAVDMLEKMERNEPDNPKIIFTKGNVFSFQRRNEDAIREFSRVLEIAQKQNLGGLDDIYMHLAFEYEYLEDFDTAIEYAKKAIGFDPSNEQAPADLCTFFDHADRIDEGIGYMKGLIESNPFASGLWMGLGILHRTKGEYEEALKCFDYVLAIDDEDLNGLFQKATTFLLLEKYNDALSFYKRILAVTPNETATLFNMGECYERMQEHSTAQTYFRKVLQLDPGSTQVITKLARSYFYQNKKNKAFTLLNDALKESDASELHATLGQMYIENDDFVSGLPHICHAVDIAHNQPEFIAAVCYAMVGAGLPNDALDFIESKISPDENRSKMILIRGIINLKIRNKDAALRDLLYAFVSDPNNVFWFRENHPELLEYPEINSLLEDVNFNS